VGPEPGRPDLDESDLFDEPGQARRRDQEQPGRLRRLPGRSRAAAARRRRSKRRLTTWGGTAIVVALLVGVVILVTRPHPAPSRFVTTLQPGEFRAVPDACKVYGDADLRQLMNGQPKSIQPQKGQQLNQCTYTVDAKPTFRVLTILVQAMQASLAFGNGSATADAKYNFAKQQQLLAKPPKNKAQPPATITPIRGMGDQALSALQTFPTKAATDVVTVLARYRNVLITVTFEGEAGNGFGPVTAGELRSGALAVARAALSRVKSEPTV
jgi:hypothetical protein